MFDKVKWVWIWNNVRRLVGLVGTPVTGNIIQDTNTVYENLLALDSALSSGSYHPEFNRMTGLPSRTVSVTFGTPFVSVPTGIGNLKVYRWAQAVTGKWMPKDVQYYFPSSGSLTNTGFTIEIEASEPLTGVIVEYLFLESL